MRKLFSYILDKAGLGYSGYRKRIEELEQENSALKTALQIANIGTWDHDFKTGKVFRNRQWAEMLDYSEDEINNEADTWKSLIHPEDLEKVERVAAAHESGKSDSFKVEHRLKTKSGHYKWILNWGKITEYDEDGQPIRALGAHIDIDHRKRAEESFRRLHKQFLTLLESMEALIHVIDINSKRILFMNKKSKENFGDKEGEICWKVFNEETGLPCEFCPIDELLDDAGNPKGVFREEIKNEKTGRWYEATEKVIYWPDDNLVKLEIAHEITGRKKTEQELEELNATKDSLFSIIGHDLKNPISDIIGFSELLYLNYQNYSDEKVEKFHELIFKSAKETHNLLDNLLEWTRLQSGKLSFMPGKVDLQVLVKEVVKFFKTKAIHKNVRLVHDFKEPLFVKADTKMIETVFRNLVSNALKYTEQEGTVNLTFHIHGDQVIISIEDDGIGMSGETVKELFQNEKEIITSGTKGEKGTGLGLVICKNFIDKHNEKLWVESEPGKGSEFKFTLPLFKSE